MPETTSQPVIRSHFVSRVTSLPAVSTALDTAKQSYNHVKDRSGLLGYTLSTAEKSAAYAVGHSLPLLEKFARPINYVDNLACKGLDRIEQSYPAVKQNSPQDIIKDAASFGLKKYVDARDYGVSLASHAVHAVSHPRETLTNAYQAWSQQARKQTVSALAAAEDTLDKELASLGVSVEQRHYEPEGEVPRRVASVVQKSRQYVSLKGQQQYELFQQRASQIATQLQEALGLLSKMKDGLLDGNKSFKDILDDLHSDAAWLKALLNDPHPETIKTLPGKALLMSQNAVHQAVTVVTEHSKLARGIQETYAKISPELNKRLAPIGHLANESVAKVYAQLSHLTDSLRQTIEALLGHLPALPFVQKPVEEAKSTEEDDDTSSTNSEN
ncbi:perilipin-5 [Rhipicephalus sanguineus]|uniref:perilipin-5 n=1 Tax=Rhipicephalus sanguineus TaxID=34632 RepID=UPI001894391A|nr:perilipin-5 [Rhipicephalus sanguineus]